MSIYDMLAQDRREPPPCGVTVGVVTDIQLVGGFGLHHPHFVFPVLHRRRGGAFGAISK